MKLLCLIKHDWEYKDDFIKISYTYSNGTTSIPTKSRLCKRCFKKQNSLGTNFHRTTPFSDEERWAHSILNIGESREKKLKELGL